MGRTIALATLVAGTLDILFAIMPDRLIRPRSAGMLRFVASGPFPGRDRHGDGAAPSSACSSISP